MNKATRYVIEGSTTYIGSFEKAADFGTALRQEGLRRGLTDQTPLVFLGDGAAWVWELARINFSQATEILDFYHASEHMHQLLAALWGKESQENKEHKNKKRLWKRWLLKGKAAQIIEQAEEALFQSQDQEQARKQIAYLQNNLPRMDYGAYRAAGYFIGSGVVEAGCKTVVGKRLKQSGMFWSKKGASHVLDLRCLFMSNRAEAFWKARAADRVAENDSLTFAA